MTWTHNFVSNTAYFVSMKKECLFKHAQTRPLSCSAATCFWTVVKLPLQTINNTIHVKQQQDN